MLASKIKFVLFVGAALLVLGQTACKWKGDWECRSQEGCECVSDCDSLPNPG